MAGRQIHYVYGLATLQHVGPFYLTTVVLAAGAWLSHNGLRETRPLYALS
jgi:hypothetical protein